MARDASGNYSLPLSPVVTGTTIEATWANTTLNDLATEMTDSLSRSGDGGMLAALGLVDGTVSAPGAGFNSESNTGIYRSAAGDMRIAVLGADLIRFSNANGVQLYRGGSFVDLAGMQEGTATGQTAVWDDTQDRWEYSTAFQIVGGVPLADTINEITPANGVTIDGVLIKDGEIATTYIQNLSGTNTGDQTSIVGITGTKSQFDTACTDGNFLYVGDAPTAHTHTVANITDLTNGVEALTTAEVNQLENIGATVITAANWTALSNLSGVNTGDAAGYTHPDHTGHVTSTGDGATVLTVAAITGQTELASGLASTDELLVSDAGTIKRMDAEVMGVYMDERVQTRAQAKSHSELGTRSTGTENIEVGQYESYFLTISGSCTIDLNTATYVGTGAKLLLGRCRVTLSSAATVSVTSDVAGAIISGTAPSALNDDAILLWEYIRTAGGTERLFAKWVNE